MDLDKIDRIHQTLRADFFVLCTEESATSLEALTAAMRLFSHLLAASAATSELPPAAMHHIIETSCRDAAALARARLAELRGYEPWQADDVETGPV